MSLTVFGAFKLLDILDLRPQKEPLLKFMWLVHDFKETAHHMFSKWLWTCFFTLVLMMSFFFITVCWIEFPVLYSRTLLFIDHIYNTLPLLPLNSQSIPPPPTLTLGSHQSVLSVSLFLFHRYVDLCHVLDSTCKWYHMVFVFFFLIYFT